jgi:hypothetical protein
MIMYVFAPLSSPVAFGRTHPGKPQGAYCRREYAAACIAGARTIGSAFAQILANADDAKV